MRDLLARSTITCSSTRVGTSGFIASMSLMGFGRARCPRRFGCLKRRTCPGGRIRKYCSGDHPLISSRPALGILTITRFSILQFRSHQSHTFFDNDAVSRDRNVLFSSMTPSRSRICMQGLLCGIYDMVSMQTKLKRWQEAVDCIEFSCRH